MTIYNLYIFDQSCKCIYYATFHKAYISGQQPKTTSPQDARAATPGPTAETTGSSTDLGWEEESKLVYGVVYSLRNMLGKLKPSVEPFTSYKSMHASSRG
jgi:hypothetical protein